MTDVEKGPTPKQMRELMACLRDHAIVSDDAVYAYLGSVLGRDVTSRKELTTVEAARIIAELHEAPHRMTDEASAALRAPFPDDQIGKLPRGWCRDCKQSSNKRCDRHRWIANCDLCKQSHSEGTLHLDYVGHADLTDRLLSVDPNWTWRHFTLDEMQSLPPAMRDAGLWIQLTVCGVTRPGFGDADGKTGGNAVKEAIGDALRNAGMRFGIALDLWAKGDRDFGGERSETPPGQQDPWATPPQHSEPRTGGVETQGELATDDLDGKTQEELLAILDQIASERDIPWSDFTKRWRDSLGGLDVDDLDSIPADVVAKQIRAVRTYLGIK